MKRKDHPPSPSVTSSSIPKKVKSPSVNETSSTSYSTEEQRERARIWAEKLKKDNLTTIDNATREAIEAAKRKHDRSIATTTSSSNIASSNHEVVSSTLLLSSSKSSLETARLAIEAARLNRERQAAAAVMKGDAQTNPTPTTSISATSAAVGTQQQHVDYFDHDNDRSSIRSNSIADSVSSRRKSLRGKVVLPPLPEEEVAVQTAIILGPLHHQSNQQRLSSSSSLFEPSSSASTTTRAKAASVVTATTTTTTTTATISATNHHDPIPSSLSAVATATATIVKSSASITSSGSKKKKKNATAVTPKKMKTKLKGITTDNDDDDDDVDAIITTTHTSGAQTNTLHQTDNLTSSSSSAAYEYRHPALDVYHLLPLENKTTSFISQPYLWVIMSLSLVVLGLLKYHEIDVSQMNIIDLTKNIGKCLI